MASTAISTAGRRRVTIDPLAGHPGPARLSPSHLLFPDAGAFSERVANVPPDDRTRRFAHLISELARAATGRGSCPRRSQDDNGADTWSVRVTSEEAEIARLREAIRDYMQ